MKQLTLIFTIAILLVLLPLSAQELSRFYCSPGSDLNPYMSFLTNGGPHLNLHYINASGTLQMVNSTMYLGNGDWNKSVVDGEISHPYVGYRGIYYTPGSKSRFGMANPIFYPDAGGVPLPGQLLTVEEDAQGDNTYGLAHQDILETRVGFSETKLYYAIRVNSNSFPVSSGFTFYSYMGVIVNPAADPDSNPTVYGMMHTVNVAGVIGPGLYKITGTGLTDLTRIGDITVTEDTTAGILMLSCDLGDLFADTDFMSWYDPAYPLILTQALTSRITLTSGIQTADATTSFPVLLMPKEISYTNEFSPVVSNIQTNWAEGNLTVSAHYYDADLNHPVSFEVSVDGSQAYHMYPAIVEGLENGITFTSVAIPSPENWQNITFSYLEGGETHNYSYQNPVSNDDHLAPMPSLSLYPNPATTTLFYCLESFKADGSPVKIYNLRGQVVKSLNPERATGSVELADLPSGIYYLRYKEAQRRFLKY